MTSEAKRFDLVHSLFTGLIDNVDALTVETASFPRRVNWRAKVEINDIGKVIGKKAAHLYALSVLVRVMGTRYGEDWKLEVLDPDDAPRADKLPIPANDNFNPGESVEFLTEVLESMLDEPASIGIARGPAANEFTFTIRTKSTRDYERLVTALPVGRETMTPVAAIGTLFRAYGRQQGVRFHVEVPSL